MIDWSKPLEFADGTLIVSCQPWKAYGYSGYMVRTDHRPANWPTDCHEPDRDPGTVVWEDGTIKDFPDLPPVRNRTAPEWMERYLREEDEEGYVFFNTDRRLGQNQYASRSVDGRHGDPNLGEGLRWKFTSGGAADYHCIRIHKYDLEIFHERYRSYKERMLNGQA